MGAVNIFGSRGRYSYNAIENPNIRAFKDDMDMFGITVTNITLKYYFFCNGKDLVILKMTNIIVQCLWKIKSRFSMKCLISNFLQPLV